MKALTVRQPWAWAIACGGKDVENRSWSTSHRGVLAIHAASRWAPEEASVEMARRTGAYIVRAPLSAVIAVAELVHVCRPSGECGCGQWAIGGQVHWRLASPRPLAEPVPCNGRPGLWDLPDDVEAAVRDRLAVLP